MSGSNAYLLLFGLVLIEQLGVPLPAAPILIGAGTLAHDGHIRLVPAIALTVIASLAGHIVWFFAGRRHGARVLRVLCEISLEPDSCVRKTQQLFDDRGPLALLFAPWVPGLGSVSSPLAGMSRMGLLRFLAIDGAASILWATLYVGAGYVFGAQLDAFFRAGGRFGAWFAAAVAMAIAIYLAVKLARRQRLLREIDLARISAADLKTLLDGGAEVLILDIRHPQQIAAGTLPGARTVSFEGIHAADLPRDREVILYCS